jgi:hypothetical protein
MTRSLGPVAALAALLAVGCFDLDMPEKVDAGTIACDGGRFDPATGLCWQDQTDSSQYSQQGAADYCASLDLAGHDDWRLPTVEEFMEMLGGCDVDLIGGTGGNCAACTASSTCSALFLSNENQGPGWMTFWTSSPCAFSANCGWWVDWGGGWFNWGDPMGGSYSARCVRGGEVDTDTGSDTGTDTGTDTGPIGAGEPCTQYGGECAGFEASFCLYDPYDPYTGYCTVSGCNVTGCPDTWGCWDCTSASYFFDYICVCTDWEAVVSAAGCTVW